MGGCARTGKGVGVCNGFMKWVERKERKLEGGSSEDKAGSNV